MSVADSGSGGPMIEASGLSKYYGPFVAVHDISFEIPQGQIVAFLGPNGAGKTTLMRMLTGYLAPSAGGASIAGFDVRTSRIEASRRLGYLPENGPLYPDMTPLELLTFFGEARELGPALKSRIEAVVDLCALHLVIEKPVGKLSRGLKQRVGLAQALLHDPDVLIMDEPTAGLDPNQIRQFRENIQRLGRTKTLLISTHILHEADAVADRVLLVNSGRLVFDGQVSELEERRLHRGGVLQVDEPRRCAATERACRRQDRGATAMSGLPNTSIVRAIAKRDLLMYFSNPTGYVFVTLFIFISAGAAFWQDRFFLQNLANLEQLNNLYPYLLLFFIPALTMSVWAEERKLGTDETLLTLPATDLEVVLGKYLATLGIYTASLVLALSYVFVLFYLGSPDLGLMFGNYVGYWFMGAALIAVGMLASLLTRNATIGFILGALFCGALIVIGPAAGAVAPGLERALQAIVMGTYFEDFARGVISLTAVTYFIAVGAAFLYLNVLVLSRRHWPARADGYPMWVHHTVRALAVVVALTSGGVVVSRAGVRVDVTAEQLHSLSGETRRLIRDLPADRPVFIQAYISPEVPEPLVQARANLLSVLDEIDALAGARVEVQVHDTESFTDAARDARETFGIRPRPFRDVRSTRANVSEVFMGLAFTCGAEEQVIPFFDRGLPTEYEVVRSIRVVAGTERKRIGVVRTMIDLMGGVDYQQNRFNPSWPVVEELRKQYEVYPVDPEQPIQAELDALLVPLPSSLQTDEMGNVADFIRKGTPAMLLVDPMPAVNPQLSPTEWVGDGNPFAYPPGSARPGPRGNVRQWMADLGVSWEPTRIVWDSYNPHPELAHMPDDVVFLGRGNGNEETFNEADSVTAGLQELVFLWPGYVEPVEDADVEFQPLLRSGMLSGTNGYFSIVRSSPFGPQINPEPPREQDEQAYVVAARIRSTAPPAAAMSPRNRKLMTKLKGVRQRWIRRRGST